MWSTGDLSIAHGARAAKAAKALAEWSAVRAMYTRQDAAFLRGMQGAAAEHARCAARHAELAQCVLGREAGARSLRAVLRDRQCEARVCMRAMQAARRAQWTQREQHWTARRHVEGGMGWEAQCLHRAHVHMRRLEGGGYGAGDAARATSTVERTAPREPPYPIVFANA
jgi:hypothetical protein